MYRIFAWIFGLVENRIPRSILVASIICLSLIGDTETRAQDVFEGLGELPGGMIESVANGISPDGEWIVGHSESSNGTEAFLWTKANGIVGLGDLEFGGFESYANAVADSSTGFIVGRGLTFDGIEPFRYSSGSILSIGGGLWGSAYGVSMDGSVITGIAGGTGEAFRWTQETGLQMLGTLMHDATSIGFGISGDGSTIVGSSYGFVVGREAFRWTSELGMIGLGDLPGGQFISIAHAVSADGSVVVGSGNSNTGIESFRWTEPSGMTGLGDLPGGISSSVAQAVSADGSVVVGVGNYDAAADTGDAFIWNPQQEMRELSQVLVDDFGFDISEWSSITSATGISADGLFLTGYGIQLGRKKAWRATADARWIRDFSGNWDDRSNWPFGIAPNYLHEIFIDRDVNVSVTGPSSNTAVKLLVLGDGPGLASLSLQPDVVITIENGLAVSPNGTLLGSGTIDGNASIRGIVRPSSATSHVGLIKIEGELEMVSGELDVDLGGFAQGESDQVIVGDDLILNGQLTVALTNGFSLGPNMEFRIIDFQASPDVLPIGQFNGLPEGALVGNFGGTNLSITYQGGNCNDVVLYTTEFSKFIEPNAFNVVRGIQLGGELDDLHESDDSYLWFHPGITLNPAEPPVWVEFAGKLLTDQPNSLSFFLEARANTAGVEQTIELFNYTLDSYQSIDSHAATTDDSIVEIQLQGDVIHFVEPATGIVRARIGWSVSGPILVYPWSISIDRVAWAFTE